MTGRGCSLLKFPAPTTLVGRIRQSLEARLLGQTSRGLDDREFSPSEFWEVAEVCAMGFAFGSVLVFVICVFVLVIRAWS